MKILIVATLDRTNDKPELISDGVHVVNHQLLLYLKDLFDCSFDLVTFQLKSPEVYKNYYGCSSLFEELDFNHPDKTIGFLSSIVDNYDLVISSFGLDYDWSISDYLVNDKVPYILILHGINCTTRSKKFWSDIKNSRSTFLASPTDFEVNFYLNRGIRKGQIIKFTMLPSFNFDDAVVVKNKSLDAIVNSRVVKAKGIRRSLDFSNSIGWSCDLIGKVSRMPVSRAFLKSLESDGINYLGTLDRKSTLIEVANHRFMTFFPDTREGVNLAIVESQIMGTPVITWEEWEESVDPRYSILLPKSDDYIRVFQEEYLPILSTYENFNRREEMSQEVKEKYSISNFRETFTDLVCYVLAKSKLGDSIDY